MEKTKQEPNLQANRSGRGKSPLSPLSNLPNNVLADDLKFVQFYWKNIEILITLIEQSEILIKQSHKLFYFKLF